MGYQILNQNNEKYDDKKTNIATVQIKKNENERTRAWGRITTTKTKCNQHFMCHKIGRCSACSLFYICITLRVHNNNNH